MKHNILWGIILLVASLSFTAKAQKAVQGQFSVKGVLLDSLSNEGEPYSTIRISLKNNPAKPVKLAVTGADGRFDDMQLKMLLVFCCRKLIVRLVRMIRDLL